MPSIFGIKRYVKNLFEDYDVTIGTGNIPAVFHLSDLKLNIYCPYSFGIEYLDCFATKNLIESSFWIKRYFYKKIKNHQLEGIRHSKLINTQFGVTLETIKFYNLTYFPIDYPMVYLSNNHLAIGDQKSQHSFNQLNDYDFIILSHSRHLWVKPENLNFDQWEEYENKNNDWLIRAFAITKLKFPKKKLLLILFEYGADVMPSKQLCKKLNIEDNVIWFPLMDRKDILRLISKVNVVATEFYTGNGVMWGGTGWETLVMGKPLLVGFKFRENSFEKLFGFPAPPIFAVEKKVDIENYLDKLISSPELEAKNGIENRKWFNKYNSYQITKKWIELF